MHVRYKHVIFDLDGTLSDSREGIFNAYDYTAGKLGLPTLPRAAMKPLIGPPLQKGFYDVYGLSGDRIDEAVRIFREYYGTKGLYENTLYPGMDLLLEELNDAGSLLYVATSKYERYARLVLEHFNILHKFREMAGADYRGVQASKIELVSGLMRRNAILDPDSASLVGDTRYDVEAAAELGIDSVGVTYGFSSLDEIEQMNPDHIARNVDELRKILLI